MIADYEVSAQLNKMFINTGERKMTDTKLDDKICSMGLSKIYLTSCFDGLEELLSQREYFLKEAWEILSKADIGVNSENEAFLKEYCDFRDAYYKLLATKDKIKDEEL